MVSPPKRLLSLEPWSVPVRDSKKMEKEYNIDKYGVLLQRFGDAHASIEEDLPIGEIKCVTMPSIRSRSAVSHCDDDSAAYGGESHVNLILQSHACRDLCRE